METYRDLSGTWLDGVFFTEQFVDRALIVTDHPLNVEISRQNSDLRQVKALLAKDVKRLGGNVLAGFQYGQRSHPFWKQIFAFKWDTESWHGRGYAAKL